MKKETIKHYSLKKNLLVATLHFLQRPICAVLQPGDSYFCLYLYVNLRIFN